uniref:C2H2-type domain-containing protein n=1 Tax=Meloidogyne hapla TaxID=6305 RepID=A0A1I8B5H2_MELHA
MSEQQDRMEADERQEQTNQYIKLTKDLNEDITIDQFNKLQKADAKRVIKQLQSLKKRISRRSEAKEGSSVHVDKEVCIQCKKEIPTLNMDRHKEFHNIAKKRKEKQEKKERLEKKILSIKQKKGLKEITAGPSTSKKSDVMPKRKRGRKETDGSVKRGLMLKEMKGGKKGGNGEEPGPSSALD